MTKQTQHAEQRNAVLEAIEQQGRKTWKQQSAHHRRTLSETAMFRLETLFGDTL